MTVSWLLNHLTSVSIASRCVLMSSSLMASCVNCTIPFTAAVSAACSTAGVTAVDPPATDAPKNRLTSVLRRLVEADIITPTGPVTQKHAVAANDANAVVHASGLGLGVMLEMP